MCKERRIYSFESENRIYGMKKSLELSVAKTGWHITMTGSYER